MFSGLNHIQAHLSSYSCGSIDILFIKMNKCISWYSFQPLPNRRNASTSQALIPQMKFVVMMMMISIYTNVRGMADDIAMGKTKNIKTSVLKGMYRVTKGCCFQIYQGVRKNNFPKPYYHNDFLLTANIYMSDPIPSTEKYKKYVHRPRCIQMKNTSNWNSSKKTLDIRRMLLLRFELKEGIFFWYSFYTFVWANLLFNKCSKKNFSTRLWGIL